MIYLLLFLCFLEGTLGADLPQWNAEDIKRFSKGGSRVDSLLLSRPDVSAFLGNMTALEPDILEPPVEEAADDPYSFPRDKIEATFATPPSAYLRDAQNLLGMQERDDLMGFLAYHAKEAQMPIYLYIFDGLQEVPERYSLHTIAQNYFFREQHCAVVFYFVGNPARAQLIFSGTKEPRISLKKTIDVLQICKAQALEKSEFHDQLEGFLIELSVRIYWMEKNVKDTQKKEKMPFLFFKKPHQVPLSAYWEKRTVCLWCGVLIGMCLLTCLLFALLWWQRNKPRKLLLVSMKKRLGLDYGASSSLLLSFGDPHRPPEAQRESFPDYLSKL